MSASIVNAALFVLAALVLLGSPGPAIAALVAIGRSEGFGRGLRFYAGLQVGLALAAAVSAGGLFSMVRALPSLTTGITILATAYLVYLAAKIAFAPVGVEDVSAGAGFSSTALGGFVLGVSNPKAYVAFVSLMGSASLAVEPSADAGLKWLLCVTVMIVVDLVWLWIGVLIRRAALSPISEHALNLAMGTIILVTALLPFAHGDW